MKKHFIPFIILIALIIAVVALGIVLEVQQEPETSQPEVEIIETETETETEEIETPPIETSEVEDISQELIGKTWVWDLTADTEADLNFGPIQTDAFSLTFDSDGSAYGTTDCNNFFGTYSIEDDRISFGPFGSTLMYCEESQESDFISWLDQMAIYELSTSGGLVLDDGLEAPKFIMVFK